MADPIVVLAQALQEEQPAVLALVVEVTGASPAKAGTQIVLLSDGRTAGTVGGGRLEAAILADARAALDDGEPRLRRYRLVEDGPEAVGVLCGGEVRGSFTHTGLHRGWSSPAAGISGVLSGRWPKPPAMW